MNEIIRVQFGSHLYHLNTEASDIDMKGIYLPSSYDILLGKVEKSINYNKNDLKNTAGQEDYEVYSFCHFMRMAMKGETVAMDILHSKNILENSDVWDFLVQNRTAFYSKQMNSFMGYLHKQFLKYGLKGEKLDELHQLMGEIAPLDDRILIRDAKDLLPDMQYCKWVSQKNHGTGLMEDFYRVNDKLIQSNMPVSVVYETANKIYETYGKRAKKAQVNGGTDWKAISHAIRVAFQLRDIYKFGDYEYPLIRTDYLLDVKLGKIKYESVVESMDEMLAEIEQLAEKSELPNRCNVDYWNKFLYDIYGKVVMYDIQDNK